jgi:glyoxylase-like metal-dependent hydrolase (beta-lactamase superfamily II)
VERTNGKGRGDGLDYPFAAPPAAGEVREVASGVFWLRMPLPYALDHINLWLLADGDAWTIVDTGIRQPRTIELWERLFATVLAGRPVNRLVVTHHHPDHVGLSAWLARRWGAPLLMPQTEWLMARALALDVSAEATAAMVDFYRRAGCDAATLDAFARDGNSYAPMVEVAASFRRLSAGDTLRIGGQDWQVIIGRGHSPEQACLYAPSLRLIIGGDQLLPRITPNVSVWPEEPEENPLPLFLDSLAGFRRLPDDVLVLPSHKLPYRGLHRRLEALAAHHAERLERTRSICRRPVTASEVAAALFRPNLDRHQLMFAIGEALAHLHHAMAQGQIRRSGRADGILLYEVV